MSTEEFLGESGTDTQEGARSLFSHAEVAGFLDDSKNSSDPFFLARITPLDEQGQRSPSWTVVVVELDERSIAFKHLVPLTARRVIVTFEKRGACTYSVEVELTWCRFDHPHLYTSGGRFVLPLGRTA